MEDLVIFSVGRLWAIVPRRDDGGEFCLVVTVVVIVGVFGIADIRG